MGSSDVFPSDIAASDVAASDAVVVARAPRVFHPPASLLGHSLRRLHGDPLRAEAVYWIVLVLIIAVGVMGTQWGWLWLRDATPPDGFTAAAVRYALAQAVAIVAVAGVALLGWKPAVVAEVTATTLRIRQGRAIVEAPRAALRGVRHLGATQSHRTLRRRSDVLYFVARPVDVVLVLDVEGRPPIVLGLPAAERERFEAVLGPAPPTSRPTPLR